MDGFQKGDDNAHIKSRMISLKLRHKEQSLLAYLGEKRRNQNLNGNVKQCQWKRNRENEFVFYLWIC